MIAVTQRVAHAKVDVDGQTVGSIGPGFMILVGVAKGDGAEEVTYLCNKIVNLRVFDNEDGKFDLSLLDVKGEALVVSQFTLLGSWRKGRRPGFDQAARPEEAAQLVEMFARELEKLGVKVSQGAFGARMEVSLLNDGPVTFCMNTQISE
ncbi:MAG: D-aminoacyl-tRNA deacylase [Nitrospinota bacterium]|nr:D-aminoacyl-tRNA deacylase [Nitrospinota bacterium]